MRFVPQALHDGFIGDRRGTVERDGAFPAAVQHLVFGVVEAFMDRPQESFSFEIFGVQIVHDPSQVRHQSVEVLFGLCVVLFIDGCGQISAERVEDLVVEFLADAHGVSLKEIEQLPPTGFQMVNLVL